MSLPTTSRVPSIEPAAGSANTLARPVLSTERSSSPSSSSTSSQPRTSFNSSPALPAPQVSRPSSYRSTRSVSSSSSVSIQPSSHQHKLTKFLRRDYSASSGSSRSKATTSRRQSDSDQFEFLLTHEEFPLPEIENGSDSGDRSRTAGGRRSARGSFANTNESEGGGRDGSDTLDTEGSFEQGRDLSSFSSAQQIDREPNPAPPKKTSRAKTLRKKTSNHSFSSSVAPASTSESDPTIVVDSPPKFQSPPTSPTLGRRSAGKIGLQTSASQPASTSSIEGGHPSAPNGLHQTFIAGSTARSSESGPSTFPTRLGGWLSNLLPNHQSPVQSTSTSNTACPPRPMHRPSSSVSSTFSEPSSVHSPLSSTNHSSSFTPTPIPPSLHPGRTPSPTVSAAHRALPSYASTGQGKRGFLAAARENGAIMRYLLDTDAGKPDRCEEGIWIMGKLHEGWKPSRPSDELSEPTVQAENFTSSSGSTPLSPPRKQAAPSISHPPVSSPSKFTSLFSTLPGSSVGTEDGSSSPRKDKRAGREEVRWPEDFYADFQTSIWCTYRSQYAAISSLPSELLTPSPAEFDADGLPLPSLIRKTRDVLKDRSPIPKTHTGWAWVKSASGIDEKGLTADTGWGCMLRTGQSLLANALIRFHLGRDWRRPLSPPTSSSSHQEIIEYGTYVKVLTWFMDDPAPFAPFSVHRMALVGKQLGKEVGEWFGPSTAGGAIKALTTVYPHAGVSVTLAADSVIFQSEVLSASQPPSIPTSDELSAATSSLSIQKKRPKSADSWGGRPVLILVNVRLGLDGVNPIYHETVKNLFTFPQSVGIAGGRPSSSYYFLGYQADSLIYLDPHHTRPAVVLRPPPYRADMRQTTEQTTDIDYPERKEEDKTKESEDTTLESAAGHLVPPLSLPEEDSTIRATTPPSLLRAEGRPTSSLTGGVDPLSGWYANAYSFGALQTFHCEKVRKMAFSQLDPSMLLGFLCLDEADWLDFKRRVSAMPNAIFSIVNEPVNWDDDDSAGLESFSETDPDDGSSSLQEAVPWPSSSHAPQSVPLDLGRKPTEEEEEDVKIAQDGEDEIAEFISRDEIISSSYPGPSLFPSGFSSSLGPPVSTALPSSLSPLDTTSYAVTSPSPLDRGGGEAESLDNQNTRPAPMRALGSEFELLSADDWTGEAESPTTDRLSSLCKTPTAEGMAGDEPESSSATSSFFFNRKAPTRSSSSTEQTDQTASKDESKLMGKRVRDKSTRAAQVSTRPGSIKSAMGNSGKIGRRAQGLSRRRSSTRRSVSGVSTIRAFNEEEDEEEDEDEEEEEDDDDEDWV
ncbi:Cysteine protease required for autophagy-Apg4p/Aut2p [Phaffia rhodozyma]|uniref:Autophagy-related protein 4 n=1 Tax=Phaffia rhodozyma TaxID=264483 RepID=A0A0F7SE88_PHARH|nr:Cysteine protease required for autophagy-Apg4p/Aut2p [Phaffia rhodozyma]